jgi:hypothetical protein
MNKLIACAVAAGTLTVAAACSSSGSSDTAAGTGSTAAGSSSGGGSTSGGSSSSRNLCEEVSASEVSALVGQTITSAEPLSPNGRFRSGFSAPSCEYETAVGLGGVSAEFVEAESYQGLTTDSVTKPRPLAGVGDEAFQAVDQVDGTKVIRTFAKRGDQYLYVQIFSGTSEDNAKTLTNKLLG